MSQFFATYGDLFVSMTLMAVLALSLYLPLMAGQLSLASPGFYALGGYVAAILSTNPGSPLLQMFPYQGLFPLPLLLLEMAIAAAASALLAILVGVPALRLRGIYLALATIAFVEVLRILSLNLDITGTAVGIFNIPQPFGTHIEYLWITGPLLLASMLFVYRLERGRVGRALIALREDELAADAMGVDPTLYKVLAFTLGAILAGMAGTVTAHLLNTWNARQGTFDFSITILAFVLIGGSRTFLGPVLGALVLTALPEVLRFLADARLVVFGGLIVLGSIFLPQGVVTPALFERRQNRAPRPGAPPPEAGLGP